MKKFESEQGPLRLLKNRLNLKCAKETDFLPFLRELEGIIKEQVAFMQTLEDKVAVCENMDPVQDITLFS